MARYEKLQQLIDLQRITTKLLAIESELAGLPERRLELQSNYVESHNLLDEAREQLQALQLTQQHGQAALDDLDAKIAVKREQLTTVRTNAEFTAMKKEMTFLEETKQRTEQEILEAMAKIEDKQAEIENLEQAANTSREEYEQEIGPLEERIGVQEKQLVGMRDEVEEVRESVDPRWLAVFDRLVQHKRGLAVAPLDEATCGGCHGKLPLAAQEAVRFGQEIIICDLCSRILYYANEEEA